MAKKPKLALIPSGYKVNKVYSVLPSDGVGDFNFSRSGNATRVNKQGLIETVSSNVPRLNYPLIDGVVSGCPSLLLEPARTNLFTYSEDFTQTDWSKFNITIESNSTISPDGTLNADKILEQVDSANGHFMFDNLGLTPSVEYNFSIFVKKLNRRYVALQNSYNTANGSIAFFDLDTETLVYTYSAGTVGTFIVSDAKIEKYPNGWYRLSANFQSDAPTSVLPSIVLADTQWSTGFSYNNLYTGDITKGIYIWGAQLEQGSYPTSYIPTSGSQTTRSAETCNNAGDVNTFNDSEGVLMAEISALSDDITNRIISLSDGTNNNIISVQFSNAQSNDIIAYYNATGQTGRVISTTSYNIKSFNKIALVWNNSSFKFYVNGYLIGSATIETPLVDGTLNQLKFQYGNSTLPFYGNTKQLQYFDTALTDTDLEELTSWTSFNEMATAQLYTIE